MDPLPAPLTNELSTALILCVCVCVCVCVCARTHVRAHACVSPVSNTFPTIQITWTWSYKAVTTQPSLQPLLPLSQSVYLSG
ncbi:rCG53793, isoform CRA_a [Rattus norvegicus]|uniref:RCG53793, isoform CRA_a n=1 Tax=Rattus norvegicus TaxID=10116 RepID=A6J983_RAT|nr:rCG53793, isoform CRA_a [Rattus norvegicus]